MSNPSSIPPSETLGKSAGGKCSPTLSHHAALSSVALFHNLTARAQCQADVPFCRLLSFLEVVGTADVPVSVFSFVSLQFCYKIGTVRMLLQIFKDKSFFSPLSTSVETTHPSGHRCILLGECVPSFCFVLFCFPSASPLPGAFLYILITA